MLKTEKKKAALFSWIDGQFPCTGTGYTLATSWVLSGHDIAFAWAATVTYPSQTLMD